MKFKTAIAIIICAFIFAGCGKNTVSDTPAERYVFAMDTEMTLRAYGENAAYALDRSEEEIKRLDKELTHGNAGSEIYRLNSNGGGEASDDTARIIDSALGISRLTDGAFDITIAPVMDLWGFYTKKFYVPSETELAEKLQRVGFGNVHLNGNTVTLTNGCEMDPGGIAKGYLSSRIMEIMKESGITSGIISLGGNVHTLGSKPDGAKWRVAIQDPFDTDSYACVLSVSDSAVITSGGYQRFFQQDGATYHHIIDPSDGYPAENGLKSVSIITNDGAMADGLSTALFVMGLDKAVDFCKKHRDFDAVLISDDAKIFITGGIENNIECPSEYEVIE